jgi:AAA domain-containing protein
MKQDSARARERALGGGGSMVSMTAYAEQPRAKILVLGQSGAGKTCLACSLLRAGYNLAIIDTDDKIYPLALMAKDRGLWEQMASLTDVQTVSQHYVAAGNQFSMQGNPTVWPRLIELSTTWPGAWPVANFDNNMVIVLDSLSSVGDAAWDFQGHINPRGKDDWGTIGKTQDSLRVLLRQLTGAHMKCHLVVLAHYEMMQTADGFMKYLPLAPGKKLSPRLAQWFDYVVLAQPTLAANGGVEYWVHTAPTSTIDLKVPRGWQIPAHLSSDLALAYLLETARGGPGPSGVSAIQNPDAFKPNGRPRG